MNPFQSILVPLDGSTTAAKSLGCATWIAERTHTRLHLLSATASGLDVHAELNRLHVPEELWPLITLHQAPEYPADAILTAIERYRVGVVIMTAHGQSSEKLAESAGPQERLGRTTSTILEQSPVPVLLLPPRYRERLPWTQVLVPITGGSATNEALARTIGIANALDLKVHVAHVADDAGDEGLTSRARYADTLHHEYQGRLDELISRALPHCPFEDARCIADLALCHGDVVAELLRLIDEREISLLVLGWHGRLLTGRARVLKRLVQAVTCPVLLVRRARQAPSRLKVGDALE